MALLPRRQKEIRMRQGDSDPSAIEGRARAPSIIHSYIGPALTAVVIITGLAVQWGVTNTKQSNQELMLTGVKTAQLADEAKISALEGITGSLVTRVGSIENQDIPGHFSKLDSIVATLTQQTEDQQKRSDTARQEQLLWQTGVSDKIDKLISSVSHMEGRQDRTRP